MTCGERNRGEVRVERDAKFQGMERGREVREGVRGKDRRKGRWGGGWWSGGTSLL